MAMQPGNRKIDFKSFYFETAQFDKTVLDVYRWTLPYTAQDCILSLQHLTHVIAVSDTALRSQWHV